MRTFAAVAVGVVACILGGALRAKNFPLDDTYIHLSYGIDFSPGFRLLVPGPPPRHRHVVLALDGDLHPGGAAPAARVPGADGAQHRDLLRHPPAGHGFVDGVLPRALPLRPAWPYLALLLIAASGNVLWLSLTGMETGLSVLLLLHTVPRMLSGAA